MRGRARGGGACGGGGGASSVCREEPQLRRSLLGRGTRGAHLKHVLHGCDAGRVPAQRLVERRRFLPRRKGSMWGRGAACGAGRREGGVRPAAAQAACAGRTPNCGGCAVAGGRSGAHPKHARHGCDAGRVPARDVCVKRGFARSVVYEPRHVRHGGHVPRPNRPVLHLCGRRVGAERGEGGYEVGFGRKRRCRRRVGHRQQAEQKTAASREGRVAGGAGRCPGFGRACQPGVRRQPRASRSGGQRLSGGRSEHWAFSEDPDDLPRL